MSGVFADSGSNQAWICGLVCYTTLGARMIKTGETECLRNTESHCSYRDMALKIVAVIKLLSVRRVLHILYASGFIIYLGGRGDAFFPQGAGC